ncbi:MAG: hypothetical protein GXP28_07655 [Planctomycetes bacterium]|nr:hypothetical protein [Planctomycetota bacterium]
MPKLLQTLWLPLLLNEERTSGLTKEKTVPSQEIDRAAARIEKYMANPEAHGFSYKEEDGDG